MPEGDVATYCYTWSDFALPELLRPEHHFTVLELPDTGEISPLAASGDACVDLPMDLLFGDKQPTEPWRDFYIVFFLLP